MDEKTSQDNKKPLPKNREESTFMPTTAEEDTFAVSEEIQNEDQADIVDSNVTQSSDSYRL